MAATSSRSRGNPNRRTTVAIGAQGQCAPAYAALFAEGILDRCGLLVGNVNGVMISPCSYGNNIVGSHSTPHISRLVEMKREPVPFSTGCTSYMLCCRVSL